MSYNLFLDDERKPSFLNTTLAWEVVRNYNQFIQFIRQRGLPAFISFDHDLADEHYKEGKKTNFAEFDYTKVTEKTGYDCAKWLVDYCLDKKLPLPKWQVHSMNPCGRENINKLLENFAEFQRREGIQPL